MYFLLSIIAATAVVPEPIKGSRIISFSFENNLINHDGSSIGNIALWFLLETPTAVSITFPKYNLCSSSKTKTLVE